MHTPRRGRHAIHRRSRCWKPSLEQLEPRLLLSGLEQTYSYWGTAYPHGIPDHTQLVSVDATSGQVTWVGSPMSAPDRIQGLIMANDGQLYGISTAPGARGFYAVDRETGQATLIGTTNYGLAGGLAYDPQSDTIYGLGKLTDNASRIYLAVFDRTTGDVTLIGSGSDSLRDTTGLAWDATRQRVIAYDNSGDDTDMYTIDAAGSISWSGNVSDAFNATSGLADNGQYLAVPLRNPYHYRLFGFFDPDSSERLEQTLLISEPLIIGGLDYGLIPASTPGFNGQEQYAYVAIAVSYPSYSRHQLVTINPTNGLVTWIGSPIDFPDELDGLIVTRDGDLYAIDGSTGDFYTFDWETGQAALVGPTGFSLAYGLAYDANTDTIYGLGKATLTACRSWMEVAYSRGM